jgi:ATP-dependent DNA helicase RecG
VKRTIDRLASVTQSIIPAPTISTTTVSVNGLDVLVIEVERSESLCSIGGLVFVRIGAGIRPLSIQEVIMLSTELGTIEWDRSPLLPLAAIEERYMAWFFDELEAKRGRHIGKRDRMRYLRSRGAVHKDMLTNAGALFLTDAHETVPQSWIRMVFMKGDDIEGSRDYSGPIWKMIADAFTDISREASGSEVVIATKRRSVGSLPMSVLREALINAVAHRNYAVHSDVRIVVSKDRMAILNPGGLLPSVDLDDPHHVARNPALCNLLYDTGFIEKYGRGIQMMRKEVAKHKGVRLEFGDKPGRFSVKLFRDMDILLDATDRRLLEILIEPRGAGHLQEHFRMSRPTLVKRLNRLVAMDLVRRTGRGAHVRYIIVEV